jgi:PAS domain S-box-containing protein
VTGEESSRRNWTPWRIALIYMLAAGGWIGGTTYYLHLQHQGDDLWIPEMAKGLAFVAVSGLLLWVLVRQMSRELETRARELGRSRARYQALFEQLPIPTFVYDVETLRILAVNGTASRHWGWTQPQLTAMSLADLCGVPPELKGEHALRELVDAMGGREGEVCVYAMRTRDGRTFPAQITSMPIEFDGRPARQVVALDVSEVVEARDQLRKANTTLESRVAERTEMLTRAITELDWFAETVSQDLQGPLRHLRQMATSLVQTSTGSMSPENTETAYRIVGSAARLANLVEELLEHARMEGSASPTALGPAGNGSPPPDDNQAEVLSLALLVSEVWGQLQREIDSVNAAVPRNLQMLEPLYWTKARRHMLARVVKALLRIAVWGETGDALEDRSSAADNDDVVVRARREGDMLALEIRCPAQRLSPATRSALVPQPHHDLSPATPPRRGSTIALLLRTSHRLGGSIRYEEGPQPNQARLLLKLPWAEPT